MTAPIALVARPLGLWWRLCPALRTPQLLIASNGLRMSGPLPAVSGYTSAL